MTQTASKLGFPAKLVGIALLAQLFILRIATWADSEQVWILGRQLGGLILLALVLFYRAPVSHDQRGSRSFAIGAIAYGWMFAVVIMAQWTIKMVG